MSITNPQTNVSQPFPEPVTTEPLDRPLLPVGNVPPKLKFNGLIAWGVVVLLTTTLVTLVAVGQFLQESRIGGDASASDLMQVQIQTKTLLGQRNLNRILPVADQPPVKIPELLDDGCYEQRLCYAILKQEFENPGAAITYLEQIDQKVAALKFELTPDQQQLRDALGQLLTSYVQGDRDYNAIPESQQALIRSRLGFTGQLSLLPAGTPHEADRESLITTSVTTIVGMGSAMILGLLAGLLGLVVGVMALVLLYHGRLRSQMSGRGGDFNIYIETFAIWIATFFGASILMGLLDLSNSTSMKIQPLIFFGSLACLAWPVIRGIPFRQVRQDIGWNSKSPVLDIVAAIPAYLVTLPLLLPGVIFVALMSAAVTLFREPHEFARESIPGHPIQEYIATGDWIMIVMIFITACIAAPIVEETMFRGVLYRHLRDWSCRRTMWLSVAFSAIVNGFIFAAIHPQGMLAVPVLMTLAICFSLTREWRGNLVSPMVMHGMHNTLITVFTLFIL